MKTILLVCGLCLVVGGCRGGGGSELLERELRLQEDRLFQLQDALDQCQAMLDASRRENQAIKKEIISGDRGAATESGVPGGISGPTIEMPAGDDEPASRLTPPKRGGSPRRKLESEPEIVPGVEVEPGMPDEPEVVPADEIPAYEDAPRKRVGGRGASTAVTDKRIVKLALNKQLTGGLSHDGQAGDEGIMVVFEPRNAAGQLVKESGDVSIVVIDPAVSGPAARVARWDYTSDEVSQHFRKTALGQGLYFELPWPSQPPKHKKVQLFVRYTTTDGRKITADQPINVDSNDRQVKNWKQSASSGKPSGKSNTAKNGTAKGATLKDLVARDPMKRREPQFLTSKNPGSNVAADKSKSVKSPSTWEKTREPRGMSPATIAASEPGDVIRIPDGPDDPDIRTAAEVRALAEAHADGRAPAELAREPRSERKPEAVSERPVWKPYR